jgi:hypothetical protein
MAVFALLEWHRRWHLSDATVHCRACGAYQAEVGKYGLFPHHACCVNAAYLRPWDDLSKVIAKVNHGLGRLT